MYSEEKAVALDCIKLHPEMKRIVNEASKMPGSHSDRWSYIYDEVYSIFSRSEVPGWAITGLTYLAEEGEL